MTFREMYGDALADQVEEIKQRRNVVELRPRPKPTPPTVPPPAAARPHWQDSDREPA